MSTVFFNIGFHIKSEDDVYRLADFVLNSGKILPCENGIYACWSNPSGSEVWSRVALDHKSKNVSLLNIDPHFHGNCMWRLRVNRILSEENDDFLDGKCVLTSLDDKYVICARIMGISAIPNFSVNKEYLFQIAFIPHAVSFFQSEEAFYKENSGTKLGIVYPQGLYSRLAMSDDADTACEDVLISRIAARIISGERRSISLENMLMGNFLHLKVATSLGELDVAIGEDKYDENVIDRYIDEQAVVLLVGVLGAKVVVS